jgi:hypothetical protein
VASSSITANLLNTVNANNALSALFASQASFANPEALAETAQAVLAFQSQFPTEQVLALSGLHTQLGALASTVLPLVLPSAQASALLDRTNSPVLSPSLYRQVSANSSNSSAISVAALPGATLTSYRVRVSQLAVAQANTSLAFTSATANNAVGGTQVNLGTGGAGTLQVTMNGASAQASYDVPAAAGSQVALTSIAAAINAITSNNDLQTVALNNAVSGTFTLSFGGQSTGAIAVGATAATVRAALAGLSTVGGAANVTVGQSGNTYTVGFTGALADQPQPQLLAGSALNSGATISTAVVGPTATVSNAAGNSTLVVTGGVGTTNVFGLSDVTGDGVAQTSATTVTTSAQDAIYTLNDAIYRATSGNSTSIDDGQVALSFAATTSGDATVDLTSDTSALTSVVANAVTAYNNLQSYLSSNSTFVSPDLAQQAESIITANAAGLASLGITGNTTLAVDDTTLSSASASAIQSVFSGPTGVATQLAQLTSSLLGKPEAALAAAPETPANNSDVATTLADFYQQLLLVGQGLGTNLSVRA